MNYDNVFTLIPGQPALSVGVLVLFLIIALYLGRSLFHTAIRNAMRIVYSSLRMGERSLIQAEKSLRLRNKEVLLELGQEQMERRLEREFFRVNTVVERELGGYPALQRMIADQITRIEEDYKESSEVSPPPPDWIKAVEAIGKLRLEARGNGISEEIIEKIHDTSVKQQKEILKEYRWTVTERHKLLRALMPYWRKLANTVDEVGKTIRSLIDRAGHIDLQMSRYEEIQKGTDKAERTLRASAFTQFFISLLVVAIAVGGAIINFNLIALPMSEMVGAASRIGAYKISDVAAMVIIFVEISMGLYLMEALRFTRLFPIISAMDDKMRHRMIWITFSILFTLACTESALAFMRDQIAADLSALRASLVQGEGAGNLPHVNTWIPMVGQMVMGFILPFALTFVAIPLESLVHAVRTVFGDLMVLLIRALSFVLRLMGNVFLYLGQVLTQCYDLLLIVPLWVENMMRNRVGQNQGAEAKPPAELVDQPQAAS